MMTSANCIICREPFRAAGERRARSGLPASCERCGCNESQRCLRHVLELVPAALRSERRCAYLSDRTALDRGLFNTVVQARLRLDGSAIEAGDAAFDWFYASWLDIADKPSELLADALRVVGSGFVVLTQTGAGPAPVGALGSLRETVAAMGLACPLLELVAFDPFALSLSTVVLLTRRADAPALLNELAVELAKHNLHAKVVVPTKPDLAGASLDAPAAATGDAAVAPSAAATEAPSAPAAAPSRRVAWPEEFDAAVYRSLHADLAAMDEDQLLRHHRRHGVDEGRRSHALTSREEFAHLVKDLEVLEIGPFDCPLLSGPRVSYFDILDREGLVRRAAQIGHSGDRIPEHIHYVSPTGDLSVIDRTFDAVLSSHAIEHNSDLIRHLQQVERLLRPDGSFLLMVPDKRYCFDHFLAASTIADVLDAHVAGRTISSLRSQIEHEALTTHNNAPAHWAGNHGRPPNIVENTRRALERYRAEPNVHVDVHAWYFSPSSFRDLMQQLFELRLTRMQVARVYPTLFGKNEFWAVLQIAG